MGKEPISPEALESAMLKALPTLFPSLLGTSSSARAEFYDKFRRETEEYDRDFINKCDGDLNTTLIFAGLFSAVASAFIVDAQHNLQPDFQEMSYELLRIIAANLTSGQAPTGSAVAFPQWSGPDPTAVQLQSILYSSLAVSLFAAFIAMLGKQWLNRYAQVEMRGSVIDRSRHRQQKMNGMVAWHFDLVMGCLPFMLQVALFLLGYALSNYLFFINKVVAGVLTGFTSFGLLFYFLITFAATFSHNCPFQTPPSLVLRSLIRFDNDHRKYLERSGKWLKRLFSRKKKRQRSRSTRGSHNPCRPGVFYGATAGNHIELPVANPPGSPNPLFSQRIDRHGFVLDSNCIALMFEMSMDADVIMAIMRFIPEVVWHTGIRKIPFERLYDSVVDCLDQSSGYPVVIPELRNRAYLGAKALLHLAIQRQCICDKSDKAAFRSISKLRLTMSSKRYDSDLESTLGIIDRIFGDLDPMDWQNFSFSIPHHAWMGHILLYRAWDIHKSNGRLPDNIKEFVLYSLRLEPPPPAPIVTDCLLIVGLFLGIGLHVDDLSVVDKSQERTPQIGRIFDKLADAFRNPTSTPEEIGYALEATELITTLSEDDIVYRSYQLFHVVMQASVSLAYSEEKKWEASRLTMSGAYKCDKFLPRVENPEDILAFLNHHFDLATSGDQNQDEPIQNALRALAYASGDTTINFLESFELTEIFIHGILHVYQSHKPPQLRRDALLFLPLIGHKFFNTPYRIMRDDQMRSLSVDWASAVDGIEHTHDVKKAALTVLYDMINSSHWRPHVVTEKWELLEYFVTVPDDSQALRRCIDNLELMEAIKNVSNPAAMNNWLTILWLKYKELTPQVQEKLEVVTKDRRTCLDAYQSIVDFELRKAENASTRYNKWSTDPAAIALRTKIASLRQASDALVSFMSGRN